MEKGIKEGIPIVIINRRHIKALRENEETPGSEGGEKDKG
jgi:hypothetical protein